MRAIFCGNFDYEARQSEVERLFRRYGRVDKVDMKSGFAFIYMEDERDAEDAIRALDRTEFGRKGRRLRVEWTKQERGGSSRRSAGPRRSSTSTRPSKTLFVINFDPYNTRIRDLERHFESYGKIVSVRIRRNFAFVQYDSLEDATRALEATNMSKLMDRVISVEFAVRDDDDQRNGGYSPERRRDRSSEKGRDRRRSPSPYQRERGSPDYGRGRSRSPYKRERGSPDYGRDRSPTNYRKGRGSPDHGRDMSQSPYRREERVNTENGHGSSRSPQKREKHNPDNVRSRSHSPYDGERASPENGLVDQDHSPSARGERSSPDNGEGNRQSSLPEHRESPYGGAESPIDD